MAESGAVMLKRYIEALKKKGVTIILTNDIHNNGFKLDVIKGENIRTHLVQPWVATSDNWEWLMIMEIRKLVRDLGILDE